MKTPSVLIIYTGGTIGMIHHPLTGELTNVDFHQIFEQVPELNRLQINIKSHSFALPLDSSEINPDHWLELSLLIQQKYQEFDGFVVLHGTDTMAYTASALSFLFDGLHKPIIFTGSQLPMGVIRTDGKENLITALEIASAKNDNGEPLVQEVAVYFDYKLFRGNRCTKVSAEHFEAFKSPNYPDLATAGVHLKYHKTHLFSYPAIELSVKNKINRRIALVKFFPGMDFSIYRNLISKETIDGLVLETFGAGNAPRSPELRHILSQFKQDGGVILNITQCNTGSVNQGLYETSSMFNDLGVISGFDMTTEAAVSKLMVNLDSIHVNQDDSLLRQNLRGEMSMVV